jgi:nucleoside-diphosphate-sugar epimerase
VTVLGGSGFLGRAVCQHLVGLGADVTAMSRGSGAQGRARAPDDAVQGNPWRQVGVDASDADALSAALNVARPQYLFHLAGLATGRQDLGLVEPLFRAHVLSTLNVLTYAAQSDCQRVILTASLEEPDPTDPAPIVASPYAAAKATSSMYGRMFHSLYRTPVVFARVFMAYGPGPQNLSKVVPYAALSMLRGTETKLSSGTRSFDWIYIEDVAAGLAACATAPSIEGQLVDIGTGEIAPVRAVVEQIAALVGGATRPIFGTLADRASVTIRKADVARTHAQIAWRPTLDLRTGLERTVSWFRTHQHELA